MRKVFGFLIFAGIGGALLVSGWQALTWLTTEVSRPVSVLSALVWLHMPWAVLPSSWQGLHQLLGNTPLAVALLGIALLSFVAYALLD
jgi:hypothetical protein